MNEFMTPEEMAEVAADALKDALTKNGVRVVGCSGLEGVVSLSLEEMRDAELLMSLSFDGPDGYGSRYDHATNGCVGRAALDEYERRGHDVTGLVDQLYETSWTWLIHPDMTDRRVSWHVAVVIPTEDALAVSATLNELYNGGAL